MKSFDELIRKVEQAERKTVAVIAADEHSIEAALEGQKRGLVHPVFTGDRDSIERTLKALGAEGDYEILDAENLEEAAEKGVRLVSEGGAQMILKGAIDTPILLRAVLNKEWGLGTGNILSHIALMEVPTYHKLFIITDGGMIPYPDLEKKKIILESAVKAMHSLGVASPKVACLAAVEKASEKLPETMDAKALKEMNEQDEIQGCVVEGPISFDLAFDKDAAGLKHYVSPVAGDADIFLVPDFVVGNILSKSMIYAGKAKMAGMVVGAKVPILLTSRASSAEEKFLSLALAAAMEDQ